MIAVQLSSWPCRKLKQDWSKTEDLPQKHPEAQFAAQLWISGEQKEQNKLTFGTIITKKSE